MGGGYWSTAAYTSSTATRTAAGISDFAYSQQNPHTIHQNLDPARINTKPLKKIESRDSQDHPESNAVFVMFDVTGSNFQRAVDAQKKLPNLMELLTGNERRPGYLRDPQVLVAANDDFHYVGKRALQISEYESDIRIDDHIRNVILVGQGGANNGESYDLGMYAAARKTVLDCMEKRNKKGYFFMYADEPIFDKVSKKHVKEIFGDDLQRSIPIADIIAELRELYTAYVIWPVGGYHEAYQQYVHLFGQASVLTLQHPNLICELIGSVIGINEGLVTSNAQIQADLRDAGVSDSDITAVSSTLSINRAITFER